MSIFRDFGYDCEYKFNQKSVEKIFGKEVDDLRLD